MIQRAPEDNAAGELLILDIGNTTVHMGIWSAGTVRTHGRVEHGKHDAFDAMCREYWSALGDDKACVVCCVANQHFDHLQPALSRICGQPILRVGHDLPLPMPMEVSEPESVGVDRICTAAAAYEIEQRACAVADFGTALTINCVDDAGAFLGGAILPGPDLQAAVLATHTEKLPHANIAAPPGPIGRTTLEAIQAGILYGTIGAVRELVERFATVLGHWPALFFTGGRAEFAAQSTEIVDRIVPDLCLRGVAVAYYRTFVQPTEEPQP